MALDAFKRLSQVGSGLFNQTQAPIAIDFGVGSMKLLQIVGDQPPTLVGAACLDTPLNLRGDHVKRLDFQLEALPKLIRQAGFKSRRVVCSIPASHTVCKHLQLVRTEGVAISDQIASAIAAQLECDATALVFRHIEIESPTAGNKIEAIGMATPRECIRRLLSGLKDARLEPVGMHSEFTAVIRAFEPVSRRADDHARTTVYLDIGAGTTKIMIGHGPKLVFARIVEVAARHLDELVSEQLHCDLAEARRVRASLECPCPDPTPVQTPSAEPAQPPATDQEGAQNAPVATVEPAVAPPRADLTEPLELLIDEVRLSLRYHDSLFPGRKADRVVFLGGEARIRSTCHHIAKTLKLSAQIGDPLARIARTGSETCVGVDVREPQPGWTVAVGLALSPTDL
ncbi:MAG: pilus assembly protein PilM [Planctomycetota bacterium]